MPTVSIDGSTISFEINNEEILYDSLSERGHELPHGCLSGSCGACRIEVLEGNENLVPAGIVESNTIESLQTEFPEVKRPIRLACRARVKGDIKIKLIP
jgi:ferredoxin